MTTPIMGELSYLSIAAEAVWGEADMSPVYFHLPVTEYSVAMARDQREAAIFTGLREPHHGKAFRGMPSGKLTTAWYGWEPPATTQSLAQYLIEWAFNPSTPQGIELPSYMAEWAEGPDVSNVLHNGLRVNACEISGSADSGNVMISLDLMGNTETAVATAQSIPADRNKAVEAEFSDCTFSIGGSPVKLDSFSLKLANNLKVKYLNSTSPTWILAGPRIIDWTFVPAKDADTYSALQRAFAEHETSVGAVIKGLHNGTGASGTFWQDTIASSRCRFVSAENQRSLQDIIMQPLNFRVLKPQSSTASLTHTWLKV